MTTPYTSADSLIEQFGEGELIQLTDRAGTGAIDDAVLARAINAVSAWVDTQVRGRYVVPLAVPLPDDAVSSINELVRHKLYVHQGTKEVHERQQSAERYWYDIRDGRTSLPGQIQADSGGVIASGKRTMVFTDDYFARMPGALTP